MEKLIETLRALLEGDEAELAKVQAEPVDYFEAAAGEVAAEDVNPLDVLTEALAGSDLDPDAQAKVMEAYETAATPYDVPAEGGYAPHQLADVFAQSLNATLEEGDYINVDNSLYADAGEPAHGDHYADGGEIKGGIKQHNETNITDADDGAVIADYANDSNFQTGSGNLQADGVWADNITTGSGNTVASAGSVIGDENVHAGTITNSEFGDGDQDRSVDVDVDVKGSFNDDDYVSKDYSDDDVTKTNVDLDVDLKDGHGYEHIPEVDHYEGAEALESLADDLLD
ncbi:MAG: hypothetical protein AAFN30_16190 [Actinomycetota bacterium]